MSKGRVVIVGGIVLIGVMAAAYIIAARTKTTSGAQSWQQLMHSDAALSQLPRRGATPPTAHLSNAQQPYPTNKWFSSLAFDQKNPVFAYPLSYALTPQGFSVSYNAPIASPHTVSTPHTNDMTVSFAGDTSARVGSYDDLSVSMQHQNGSATIANSRITEGSPYVFVTLSSGKTATVASSGSIQSVAGDTAYFQLNGKTYGLTTQTGKLQQDGGTVRVTGSFAVYILPIGAERNEYRAAAKSPLSGTAVSYQQHNNRYLTTYTLSTADKKPTIWGTIPQQGISGPGFGTLPSLAGTETFVRGNAFTNSQAFQAPASSLPVGNLTAEQRATLTNQLKQDASSVRFDAADTYFGGKELYRAANLLQIAEQLGQKDVAANLKSRLAGELSQWLDPAGSIKHPGKYFYYDDTIHGIVGVSPSFGSDAFNDHHFHYGYILYATAVLSQYDPDFKQAHQDMANLLVRDIANPVQDAKFPRLRAFDTYFGHSWASGFSPFGDGNNQESSSEAVLAWSAVYLWAKTNHDDNLQQLAGWLYQRETAAAQHQWLDFAVHSFPGYTHPLVSLVWGGKFDYATWFSDDPAAKLAIQLIPLSPAHSYVANNPDHVHANLATVTTPTTFKDYYAMYKATVDSRAATQDIRNLAAADFDSANSKTYALAWAFTSPVLLRSHTR